MIGFIVRVYKSFKYLNNISLTLSREYSRGVEDALDGFRKAHRKAADTITDLVVAGEDRQDDLRKTYTNRIDGTDKAWNERCMICKRYTENERARLRSMQVFISKFTIDFMEVYASLLKYMAHIREASDKILIGAASIKDSESRLERIKGIADKLIKEAEPVMKLTEEDLSAKERARGTLSANKPGSTTSDGGSGKST